MINPFENFKKTLISRTTGPSSAKRDTKVRPNQEPGPEGKL